MDKSLITDITGTSYINKPTIKDFEDRKTVRIYDSDSDETYYVLLNDSQINLLNYLLDNFTLGLYTEILDKPFLII